MKRIKEKLLLTRNNVHLTVTETQFYVTATGLPFSLETVLGQRGELKGSLFYFPAMEVFIFHV